MISATPQVGIVMGSSSDWDTMKEAAGILAEFGVPHECRVLSAHRMPDDLFAYAEAAAGRGLAAIIAGAGGAAHLPGMLAAKTVLPVLGVPVASRHLQGRGFAAFHRPDAARRAGGHFCDRQRRCGKCGAVRAVAMLARADAALLQRLNEFRTRQTEAARAMTVGPA